MEGMRTSIPAVSFSAVFFALLASASPSARADTPTLNLLSEQQASDVMQNFGGALAFRPVETPSSYGKIFGLSFGILAGVTSAGKVNDVLAQRGVNEHVPALPMADIFGGIQLPYGIGVELMGTPKVRLNSFESSRLAGSIRWTFTDTLLGGGIVVPFDAALRVGVGKSSMSYQQTVSGVADTVKFDSTVTMAEVAFSRTVAFLEPYVGLGYAHMSNTLANGGTVPLYNFSSSQEFKRSESSFLFNVGLQAKLTVLAVTAEYDNALGNSTGLLKLSFKL